MHPIDAAVEHAAACTDWDSYVREPDGSILPQVSSPRVIAAMLKELAIESGNSVLEIGTGSGYSTALLAQLVGARGSVVSVELVPELVERARRRFASESWRNIRFIVGNGSHGWSEEAPFDRIIVWATAPAIPLPWPEQLRQRGRLVAPVKLLPRATCVGVMTGVKGLGGSLVVVRIAPGSFTSLDSTPRREWLGPAEDAEVARIDDGEASAWLSAAWLESLSQYQRERVGLDLLTRAHATDGVLADTEDRRDFFAFLMAQDYEGFTTAFTSESGVSVGCSMPESIALERLNGDGALTSGDDVALVRLRDWVARWRDLGRPGFGRLGARLAAGQEC
jgi:protein-L-isoaspartate(D-aspartate) O-methyltransferase